MPTVQDQIVRATCGAGNLRAIAVTSTRLVERSRRRHGTYPVATAALGRALTATLLLGQALIKPPDRITLRLLGDGPLGAVVADADALGKVRGYLQQPKVALPLKDSGKLDVGRAVGRNGRIAVSRTAQDGRSYASTVALVSGEIGEDVASYLWRSEQVPSAVTLGVLLRRSGSVQAAGGLLLQMLPGGERYASGLEERVQGLGAISLRIAEGLGAGELLAEILGDMEDFQSSVVGTPRLSCTCSRARARQALLLLGPQGLQEIAADGGAELVCHFCEKVYRYTVDELQDGPKADDLPSP